ncbi:MAG TPA: SUMF1/EgtB/PvdO family nonheme iron enzyme [Kofleriaceae bacterium]|nr:SUMF1/EgtB/PvdO family nonheme iron enzyme [Kofleriaceae bacterium]
MKRIITAALAIAACGTPAGSTIPSTTSHAPLSIAADARMITIPAGQFIAGSTPEERAAAYDDYEATSSTDAAREHDWFGKEADRHLTTLEAYRIDLMPVTQVEYAEFVQAGLAPPPAITAAAWKDQGFVQDYETQVARFVWRDGHPPAGREDHPVVLVTHAEAAAYCAWRGKLVGSARRLPTAAEYEKAARGESGMTYPWGNVFEAEKLNSHVAGPGDTTPVGTYSNGASPYGVLDLAGNVFQWTATAVEGRAGEMIVKGSAWEDYAGLGRGASGHARPTRIRHVIVGFRCAGDAGP